MTIIILALGRQYCLVNTGLLNHWRSAVPHVPPGCCLTLGGWFKVSGPLLPPYQVRTIMFHVLGPWVHGLQISCLSTVCLLAQTQRSPAQDSRDKTLSVPGMGVPGCSISSLKINFQWIKRTFILHRLSHFVLVCSRLHTLCRHPERCWCSDAHLGAWPRFTCPLARRRGATAPPLHTCAEEIGLSFVSPCNWIYFATLCGPDCTRGLCLSGWMLVLDNMKASKNWRGVTWRR